MYLNYIKNQKHLPQLFIMYKLLLMDITPRIIQCALIRSGYEYKIVKKYNVYIKANFNVTVSRKAYISNYKEAFRIELL